MTTVADAKAMLAALETKLADTRQWQIEIETATKACAFEAHVSGGDARSKLDNLNDQAIAAGREVLSLETAIAEAQVRLQAAQAAELDAQERAKASRALALLDGFAARGRALDKAFEKVLAEYSELGRDFRQLEALGFAPTSFQLIAVNMQRAVATKLQFTDLQQEFLAPHTRRDFNSVVQGWTQNVRLRIQARLNKGTPADEAA